MFGMLTCRRFTDFIIDYVEEALDQETVELFERHIAKCPQCKIYLDQYRETMKLTQDVFACEHDHYQSKSSNEGPPQELIDAVITSLEEKTSADR